MAGQDSETDIETHIIHQRDCFTVLEELPANSVHAIVTDPPYAEGDYDGMMGEEWDSFDGPKEFQEWCHKWAEQCKRVLKPGGHLIAFGSNDGHHRMFCGVEDAGFEIRDTLTWHYSDAMPKGQDISKLIDRREGKTDEREVIGERTTTYDGADRDPEKHSNPADDSNIGEWGFNETPHGAKQRQGATERSRQWDGWRTGLKNASEFAVLARTPLSEGTAVDNVLEHETGGLHVNGCRITPDGWIPHAERELGEGRYPMNTVFSHEEAQRLDERNNDSLSTYFYCPKASPSERTVNDLVPEEYVHPTQKPEELMKWLVTLVTRENHIVLDPFAGSGTTCVASKELGRQFIGIEKDETYADIARLRSGLALDDPTRFNDDDQSSISEFTD